MDVAGFFKSTLEESKKRVGGDGRVLVRGDEDASQRGVPAPGLALRYIFNSHIIPFGKILGLAGPKASMKSAFGFSLGALAAEWGGGFHLVETEDKLNEYFMYSFFKPEHRNRISVDYVKTVEEAQACTLAVIKKYKKSAEKNPFPLVLGIDSLAGSDTEGAYAKMDKSGHAERTFPEAPLLYSPFFKKLSSDLAGYDILLYFTNHLKEKPAEPGGGFGKQYTKQGGVAQDFHAAQYLYMNKVGNIDLVSRRGKLIQIKAEKCGLGPDNRKIQVPVIWENIRLKPEDEPWQYTFWDWGDATAKLLAEGTKVTLPKSVQAQLDVKCSANRYSSKELGLSGLSGTEFGNAVMENEEYVEEFRKTLGYKKWTTIGTPPK